MGTLPCVASVALLLGLLSLATANPRPPHASEQVEGLNMKNKKANRLGSQGEERPLLGTAGWGLAWSPGPSGTIGWPCEHALGTLQHGMDNQTLWAFQMMDSSALVPVGLVYGSTHQLGHYEECLGIEPPDSPFWGKYCLANVRLDWRQSDRLEEGTIWNMIWTSTIVKSTKHRDRMAWGICLPGACTASDARYILSSHLKSIRATLHVDEKGVTVGEVSCKTMDPRKEELNPESIKPLTRGQVTMTIFILCLCMLVLLGTLYEERCFRQTMIITEMGETVRAHESFLSRLLLCFSIRRNWKQLTKTRPEGEPPQPFDAVHGIKACTMFMVTVGHRPFTSLGMPMFNAQFMEYLYTRPETSIILGGTVIVDTFFFMSGCLLLYGLLERRALAKSFINIPLLYLRRYIRLVPAMMLVVAFYATIFPRMGTGPLWDARIGQERNNCIKNWWANLFLVQTYVHPEEICLIQSWYVAVEFQAFLLCAPVSILVCRHRRTGIYVLTFMAFISVLVPFVLTIVYSLDALLLPYIPIIENLARNPTFQKVYIPTYMRATPYFIGMFCALAIRWANKNRFKLPKWLTIFFHVSSFLLLLFVCYSSWIFFRPGSPRSPLAAATYAVLARTGWSVGIAWQMFAPATGHGWWIGRVFAWRPLAPLGRLSYGAFLTHVGFQIHEVATMATPINVTVMYLVRNNFADFLFSYFLSTILFLSIESPLTGIEKVIFGSSGSGSSSRRPGMAQNGAYSLGANGQTLTAHPLMKVAGNGAETSH